MSIIEERLAALDNLKLGHGSHASWEQGACVMEAVAYVAGEPFSDHPQCASPILGTFLRSWNDSLSDDDRQMLKPYIPRLVGTNTGRRDEERRAWMLTDWLARECAPAFLSAAGLVEQARALESLAPLRSAASARKAQPVLAAAGDAAGDAAWTAARAAAGDAAGDAAWAAAGAAARAAAGAAAWDAAGNAARAAAGDAAWDAARTAAWAAAGAAALDAALDAAWDALAPTVKTLQQSALLLLDRMIEVGAER